MSTLVNIGGTDVLQPAPANAAPVAVVATITVNIGGTDIKINARDFEKTVRAEFAWIDGDNGKELHRVLQNTPSTRRFEDFITDVNPVLRRTVQKTSGNDFTRDNLLISNR